MHGQELRRSTEKGARGDENSPIRRRWIGGQFQLAIGLFDRTQDVCDAEGSRVQVVVMVMRLKLLVRVVAVLLQQGQILVGGCGGMICLAVVVNVRFGRQTHHKVHAIEIGK